MNDRTPIPAEVWDSIVQILHRGLGTPDPAADVVDLWLDQHAVRIPPPWEPDPAAVEALRGVTGGGDISWSHRVLRDLHAQGWHLVREAGECS